MIDNETTGGGDELYEYDGVHGSLALDIAVASSPEPRSEIDGLMQAQASLLVSSAPLQPAACALSP
jgi:hypothetical protein